VATVRKYARVADALRTRIDSGVYRPGVKLPSMSSLRREFHASDTVILEARRILVAEGRIETRPGSGTYVLAPRAAEPLHLTDGRTVGSPFQGRGTTGRETTWTVTTESTTASPQIAAYLGITTGDRVMRSRYLFEDRTRPVQLATSHEPYALVGRTPAVLPEEGPLAGLGVIDRMRAIGIRITRESRRFTSRPASAEEARTLGGVAGTTASTMVRIYYADDQPVETTEVVILADRFCFAHERAVQA
jgi:Transcriptional regulators